jgi:hypothetical protein
MENAKTVKDLESVDISFVSDSQDVQAIKKHLGHSANGYNSFFVNIKDGDYSIVYGMFETVPWHTNQVYRIV